MFPKIENPGIKRNYIESHFVFHLFGHPVITYHRESNKQTAIKNSKPLDDLL